MSSPSQMIELDLGQLTEGTILLEDVISSEGQVLVRKNTALTESVIRALSSRRKRGEKFRYVVSSRSTDGKIKKLSNDLLHLVDKSRYSHIFGISSLKQQIEKILSEVLCEIVQDKTIHEYINSYLILQQDDPNKNYFQIHHTMNVFVLYVGSEISYSQKFEKELLKSLGLCALIHDMALTDVEDNDAESIAKHPLEVVDCFRERLDEREKRILLHHHENHDGSGYPNGLAEEEIDHYSGLLAVCDSFDQLINAYSNNPDFRPEFAKLELQNSDHDIFHALLDIVHLSNIGTYDHTSVKKLVSFFNQKELLANPALINDLRTIPLLCPRREACAARFGPKQTERPTFVRCMDPDETCNYSKNPRGPWGRIYVNEEYQDYRRCLPLTGLLTNAYRIRAATGA